MIEFKFLDSSHASQIIHLRRLSFISYYGADCRADGLDWNQTDAQSIHLGLWEKHTLIAVLRYGHYANPQKLMSTTLITPPSDLCYPAAVLSRAATHPDFTNQGLHSRLRHLGIQLALRYNARCLLGSLTANSPRLSQMLVSGYEILQRQNGWEGSYINAQGEVLLMGLTSQKKIREAMASLHGKYAMSLPIVIPQLVEIT